MSSKKQLEINEKIFNLIEIETKNHETINAVTTGKIANRIYKNLPVNEEDFLDVCKELLTSDDRMYFSIGTLWLKKRKSVINMRNMEFFETIVLDHLNGWDQVDQFCYRVMNPVIELDDNNYRYLIKWSNSSKKDVRRVSLVSMIRSGKRNTLEYEFDVMISLVNKLKHDEDIHVRKAVGWLLKCGFVKYPVKVEQYLLNNIENLDRMIFRYALENQSKTKRKQMMNNIQDS